MRYCVGVLMLLSTIITGCSLLRSSPVDVPIIAPGVEVKIDPRALEPCKPLTPLSSAKGASEVDHYDILLNVRTNSEAYRDCSMRQLNSIEIIKQLSNKKESK